MPSLPLISHSLERRISSPDFDEVVEVKKLVPVTMKQQPGKKLRVKFQCRFSYCMALLCLMAVTSLSFANNIVVSNLSIEDIDTGNGNAFFEFDISWEHSWRVSSAPANWDAAWIFFKFRIGTGEWQHASLSSTGHVAPDGTELLPGLRNPADPFDISTNPALGVFLYRNGDGIGPLSKTNVRVLWNYAADSVLSHNTIDVQVHAIEMVYIPAGSFWLGDGTSRNGGTDSHFFDAGSSSGAAVQIGASVPAISNVNDGSGIAGQISWVQETSTSGSLPASPVTLPATFPTGYSAFYAMKYEISQNDWIAFFNTLTDSQKVTRDITSSLNGGKNSDAPVVRNHVSWSGGSTDATLSAGSHGWVACNYLAWADLAAYLDWSGLRPMTELEFEKIARGPLTEVSGEFPWGTTGVVQVTGIIDSGLITEVPSDGNIANLVFNSGTSGPIRVGSIASGSVSRENSGASYYGVFDMAGNVSERIISLGSSVGRAFTGEHGDGKISSSGDADVNNWPATNASGTGRRGGDWGDTAVRTLLSSRTRAGGGSSARSNGRGGRGVRSIQ